MNMCKWFVAASVFLSMAWVSLAQGVPSDFPNYGTGSLAISSTPGTQGGSAAAFWNPAGWAALNAWEASFSWNDHNVLMHHMDDWGLFLGGHGLGFAMKRQSLLSDSARRASFIEDYQLGLGGGDPGYYWGIAYAWTRSGSDTLGRDQYLSLGSIYRPLRYVSVGGTADIGMNNGDYRGIADVGVRPLGSHRVTAFADAAFARFDNPTTMQWGAGIEVQPLDGIRAAFKVSKLDAFSQDKVMSVSLGLALDDVGFQVVPHYDKDNNRLSTSYLIRCGGLEPDFSTHRIFDRGKHVVALGGKKNVVYQAPRWFSRDKVSFYETLETIESARQDPAVGGIVINMSGLNASREMVWELREELLDFKQAGKKVYIYADDLGMTGYYFASVADYLWIDPEGMIMTPGFVAGRTYLKGTLEKLGLGVEEWRFFKYKSAMESLARKNMSEADREQRLVLIQDFYDEWSSAVAKSRHLSLETVRAIIDTMGVIRPEEAHTLGLVDSIGTWDDTPDFIEHVAGKKPNLIGPREIEEYSYADPEWGAPPEIALVYAVGESAMDTGFKGRYTSRILRTLGKNDNVKAIVLRADSPGGDALAADLIARQMKETRDRKPVIVTEGDVAGSGGYWISMYGKPIYASPFSITGSIGVIGGWIWNEGFKDKTGLSSDHVQVGEHADLGFGVTLPLLGAQIPDRNLDSLEHARMERSIRGLYVEFTQKVADGRGLEQTYVDSVGQGRIWSGTRAIDVKLVDRIGGLEDALADARSRTGLAGRRHVSVMEYPKRSLFGFDELMNPMSPFGLMGRVFGHGEPARLTDSWKANYEWKVMEKMARSPGKPLLMVPPEDIPLEN